MPASTPLPPAMSTLPLPLQTPGLKYQDTVAHRIAAALRRHGVQLCFGQSLPSLLHLACEQLGIRQIGYRTENAGGCMADGFARVAGRAAVLTAQNGPAATLLVPPLAEALKASIPIVALVQDIHRAHSDRNAFQEFDHQALFASCAKFVRRVSVASRVEDYIDMAFTAACSGRPGPAVLLLPADLLAEAACAPAFERSASLGHYPLDRLAADRDAVREAARWIAQAERPIVVAGGGVHSAQAWDALAALQDRAHLPVATTVMGKGAVSELHPLSPGVMANCLGPRSSARSQRALLSEADLVLLVGNRTNQNGTDSWTLYPPHARYIHVDIDALEVGRTYEALRLVGDARRVLEDLLEALRGEDLSRAQAARPALERRIAQAKRKDLAASDTQRLSAQAPIRPERLMHELAQRLEPTDIVVADASYASLWVSDGLRALRPGMRFLAPRGLAGLGWGFPMALGAKLASPGSTVYCLAGDGGFGHVWSELETARRLGIKVVLMVINNGVLGFQKHAENLKFGAHTSAVHFAPVNHAAIAEATGCVGITVRDPSGIAAAFEAAAAAPSTVLIDLICDENAYPPITAFSPDDSPA